MTRIDSSAATSASTTTADLQFLRVAEVCALLRISRPTLWRLRRANEFPAPTCLSRRSIGWRRADVEAWTRSRPEADLTPRTGARPDTVVPREPAAARTRTAPVSRHDRRKRSQLALGLPPP